MRIQFSQLVEYNDPNAKQCLEIFEKLRLECSAIPYDEYVTWLEKTLPCKVIRNNTSGAEIEFEDKVYTMLVLRYG
jgi:hypothetical protein